MQDLLIAISFVAILIAPAVIASYSGSKEMDIESH
jgi:hypothetical protein